jgi:hypothetical protein
MTPGNRCPQRLLAEGRSASAANQQSQALAQSIRDLIDLQYVDASRREFER